MGDAMISGDFVKRAAKLQLKAQAKSKSGKSKLTLREMKDLLRSALGVSRGKKLFTPILPCGVTPGTGCT